MELITKYQQLLNENKQISLSGNDYSGYLTSADRKSMRVVFENFADRLGKLARQLEKKQTYTATNESIESLKLLNQLINRISEMEGMVQKETDKDLYQLQEIPLQGALELVQADNLVVNAVSGFRKNCESVLENEELNENSLSALNKEFDNIKEVYSDRHNTIKNVVDIYNKLNNIIQDVGKQIDQRQIEELQSSIETILTEAVGMTKPQNDLINQFKERQIFIFRRAERSMNRDETAIAFFENYIELLEQVKVYLEENEEVLLHNRTYQELSKTVNLLPRIRERQETLLKISGINHSNADESADKSNSNPTENHTKNPIKKIFSRWVH